MVIRQNLKQAVQLIFGLECKQPINLAHIPVFRWIASVCIENQCFQQIHFRAVPEMVALGAAGVLDNDINEQLRHQFLTVHFRKAVPGIRVLRLNKVKHLYDITFLAKILACLLIKLTLGIADNERFAAFQSVRIHTGCALKNTVDTKCSCFLGAACAVYGNVTV